MFVLVHKGYVVLGPFKWARTKFETALEEDLEITHTLPSEMPEDQPYTIDKNTKIYSVQPGTDIPHNPRIEVKNGPFWTFTDTHAVYHYEPIRLELQTVKSFLLQELAAERWKKENKGIEVTVNGTVYKFNTDVDTRNRLQVASNLTEVNWKVGQDNWVTFSQSDIQTVLTAILTHVQQCFDWEKQMTDTINACQTHEALLDIVIAEPVDQPK